MRKAPETFCLTLIILYISFRQIVIERYIKIGHKGQGFRLVLVQSIQHVFGRCLLAATSLFNRRWRKGQIGRQNDRIAIQAVGVFSSLAAKGDQVLQRAPAIMLPRPSTNAK